MSVQTTSAHLPVPNRLNALLVGVVFMLAVALLWLASWLESWPAIIAVGGVFSYVLLTNYALLHEATHNNLHSDPSKNYWLGLVAGLLFPIPFSMIRITHQ